MHAGNRRRRADHRLQFARMRQEMRRRARRRRHREKSEKSAHAPNRRATGVPNAKSQIELKPRCMKSAWISE